MSATASASLGTRVVLGISAFFAFAIIAHGREPKVDVRAIFSESDFIPHIPAIAKVKRDFSNGSVMVCTEDARALVFRAAPDRWILFHYEEEFPEQYSGVTEIEYLSWAPTSSAKKLTKQDGLRVVSLDDIQIGDFVRKLQKSGRNFRTSIGMRHGKNVQIYEFNPHPKETDLYARVFVDAGIVVGFSLGVTE